MKKLILIILVMLLIGLVTAGISQLTQFTPDIQKHITTEQKTEMKDEFGATGYRIVNCWWVDDCYFCNLEIGTLNLTKRMITCHFGQDKKIYNSTRDHIGNMTMKDLVDKDVIEIVNAYTKDKIIRPDDKNLGDTTKSWNTKPTPK